MFSIFTAWSAINEHSPDTFLMLKFFIGICSSIYLFLLNIFNGIALETPFLELQCNCDQRSFFFNWWFCNSCCSCPEDMRGNGNRKYWFMKPSPALPSHYVESLCLGGFCNPLSFHVPPPSPPLASPSPHSRFSACMSQHNICLMLELHGQWKWESL